MWTGKWGGGSAEEILGWKEDGQVQREESREESKITDSFIAIKSVVKPFRFGGGGVQLN